MVKEVASCSYRKFCVWVIRLAKKLNLSGACIEEMATRYQVAIILQINESPKYRYQEKALIHVTTTDSSKRKT